MNMAPVPVRLSELLASATCVNFDLRAQSLLISELCLDSRAVRPGDAFVALQGSTQHGLLFAEKAQSLGASVVLWESTPDAPTLAPLSIPLIEVKHLRSVLGAMAARLYQTLPLAPRVLGVTGTNGKTSTVQLLAQALSLNARPCGSIGTLGVRFGAQHREGERTTPDVISVHRTLAWMRAQGATDVAMEVSSHALDQRRVDGVQFEVAVFTNLTRDHLDYHPSMAAYGAAKAKLFSHPGLKSAVINIDDDFGRKLCLELASSIRCWRFGTQLDADVRAEAIKLSDLGAEFTLHTPFGQAQVRSPLLGRFNVFNLLGVIATMLALGVPLSDVVACTTQLTPVAGRMSKLGGGNQPLVVVDYAHTPDALEQVLGSLREHTRGKLICVFGCGGDRDPGKRPLMAAAVDQLADVAIVTNDNPRHESETAITGQMLPGFSRLSPIVEHRRERAITDAVALAGPGDVVLIAGKGHENYQEVRGVKLPFDDYLLAREVLTQRQAA